jgi:PEP-CTERM motif-containing protein
MEAVVQKVSLVRTAFLVTLALMAAGADAEPIRHVALRSALADSDIGAILGTAELTPPVDLAPLEDPHNDDESTSRVSGRRDDEEARSDRRSSLDAINIPVLDLGYSFFRTASGISSIYARESVGINPEDPVAGSAVVFTEGMDRAGEYVSVADAMAPLSISGQPSGSAATVEGLFSMPSRQGASTAASAAEYARALAIPALGDLAVDPRTAPDATRWPSPARVPVPEPSTLLLAALGIGLLRRMPRSGKNRSGTRPGH